MNKGQSNSLTNNTVKNPTVDYVDPRNRQAKSVLSFDFYQDYSQSTLKKMAGAIVTGTVTSSSTSHSRNFPLTRQKILLNKVYKNKLGIHGLTVVVNQIGDKDTVVSESVILRPGTKVLLYVRPGEKGEFNLINEGQSIFVRNGTNGKFVSASENHQYSLSELIK